jgi:hypothetical protein
LVEQVKEVFATTEVISNRELPAVVVKFVPDVQLTMFPTHVVDAVAHRTTFPAPLDVQPVIDWGLFIEA